MPVKRSKAKAESEEAQDLEEQPTRSQAEQISVAELEEQGVLDVESYRENKLGLSASAKFNLFQQQYGGNPEAVGKIEIHQLEPVQATLGQYHASKCPDYEALYNFVRDTFWRGDDAVFRWRVNTHGTRQRAADRIVFKADPIAKAQYDAKVEREALALRARLRAEAEEGRQQPAQAPQQQAQQPIQFLISGGASAQQASPQAQPSYAQQQAPQQVQQQPQAPYAQQQAPQQVQQQMPQQMQAQPQMGHVGMPQNPAMMPPGSQQMGYPGQQQQQQMPYGGVPPWMQQPPPGMIPWWWQDPSGQRRNEQSSWREPDPRERPRAPTRDLAEPEESDDDDDESDDPKLQFLRRSIDGLNEQLSQMSELLESFRSGQTGEPQRTSTHSQTPQQQVAQSPTSPPQQSPQYPGFQQPPAVPQMGFDPSWFMRMWQEMTQQGRYDAMARQHEEMRRYMRSLEADLAEAKRERLQRRATVAEPVQATPSPAPVAAPAPAVQPQTAQQQIQPAQQQQFLQGLTAIVGQVRALQEAAGALGMAPLVQQPVLSATQQVLTAAGAAAAATGAGEAMGRAAEAIRRSAVPDPEPAREPSAGPGQGTGEVAGVQENPPIKVHELGGARFVTDKDGKAAEWWMQLIFNYDNLGDIAKQMVDKVNSARMGAEADGHAQRLYAAVQNMSEGMQRQNAENARLRSEMASMRSQMALPAMALPPPVGPPPIAPEVFTAPVPQTNRPRPAEPLVQGAVSAPVAEAQAQSQSSGYLAGFEYATRLASKANGPSRQED